MQQAGAQVEHALVTTQLAVAQIQRLVLDEQADQLAVRDVDDRLPGFGIAVAGLGVRQRPVLEEAIQVRAGEPEGLALVEVAAEADVPVREREQRLGLRQVLEIERGFVKRPRLHGKGRMGDHRSSARS